jgi:hypothetical protein
MNKLFYGITAASAITLGALGLYKCSSNVTTYYNYTPNTSALISGQFYKNKNKKQHTEYVSYIIKSNFIDQSFIHFEDKISKPTFEEIEKAYGKLFTINPESIKNKNDMDEVIKNYLDNNKLTQKHLHIYFGMHVIDIEILDNTCEGSAIIQIPM